MKIRKFIVCAALLLVFVATSAHAECKRYIELHSAKHTAREYGKSEAWVIRNHKVNLWAKTSPEGKFPLAGKMRPGSRAIILDERGDDYKVRSPLDSSIGWVNRVQVSRTLMQDTETFKPCS